LARGAFVVAGVAEVEEVFERLGWGVVASIVHVVGLEVGCRWLEYAFAWWGGAFCSLSQLCGNDTIPTKNNPLHKFEELLTVIRPLCHILSAVIARRYPSSKHLFVW